MRKTLDELLARAERVLEQVEQALPAAVPPTDWKASIAFRWRKTAAMGATRGWLQPVRNVHRM